MSWRGSDIFHCCLLLYMFYILNEEKVLKGSHVIPLARFKIVDTSTVDSSLYVL